MLHERGMIKWNGLMLPEHMVELLKWKDENHYEERPQLDNFDLQAIQEEVEVAFKRQCQVLIKTWIDGKIITQGGVVEGMDRRTMAVIVEDPFGTQRILVSDIIGIQCMD